MSPDLATILGRNVGPQPDVIAEPAWTPGYNPRTGWAPPGDPSYDTSGFYQPIPLAKPLPPGVRPEDFYQPLGLGGRIPSSEPPPVRFIPNVTQRLPQQHDPMQYFMELLRQLQTLKPQQQMQPQMPQMPDISRILQMIGPIMQQIGPMIRSFQQPQQPQPTPRPEPSDTTSVFD